MKMPIPGLGAMMLLAGASAADAAPDIATEIQADYRKDLAGIWDDFHRHPELSMKEARTAAIMAKELRRIGATVTEGVGGTGVVAVMQNGAGPTILVRADMDGLPILENSGLRNGSTVRQVGLDGVENPVMHACGHDAHITALLATARRMAATKSDWRGTIVFIAQPGEESGLGARAMLADGLYTRFPKPDYALALHVNPLLPTGTISASEGLQYSSSDSVNIAVLGIGAHGAAPHQGKDPVYMASQLVVALQGLISREKSPLKPAVITVGAFNAGSKHNIISDRADLQITVRANDETTRAELLAGIRRVAEQIGRLNGMPEDKLPVVNVLEGTPTTVNDAGLARRLNSLVATRLSPQAVIPFEQVTMSADDFAYFVAADRKVRGYYFYVGSSPKAELDTAVQGGPPVASYHSANFRIDPQATIETGTRVMTLALLDLLKPAKARR